MIKSGHCISDSDLAYAINNRELTSTQPLTLNPIHTRIHTYIRTYNLANLTAALTALVAILLFSDRDLAVEGVLQLLFQSVGLRPVASYVSSDGSGMQTHMAM